MKHHDVKRSTTTRPHTHQEKAHVEVQKECTQTVLLFLVTMDQDTFAGVAGFNERVHVALRVPVQEIHIHTQMLGLGGAAIPVVG